MFTMIGESIGRWFLPILDVLGNIIAVIANTLVTTLQPVLQLVGSLFQVIGAVLSPLAPIIGLVSKAFIILASPIQWVADLFTWLADWMIYFGKCLGEVINHILDIWNADFSGSPGSFKSDAFTGLEARLQNVDSLSMGTPASMAVGTQQAVQNASYSGSANVTLNVYVEGNVYGDGGIETLAKQIRAEFLELDRYGI